MSLGWSVGQVDEMPHREFLRWCKFYAVEPFGSEQDNHRAAMIASAIYNGSTKFKSNHSPAQFMPNYNKQAQTMEQQIAIMKGLKNG